MNIILERNSNLHHFPKMNKSHTRSEPGDVYLNILQSFRENFLSLIDNDFTDEGLDNIKTKDIKQFMVDNETLLRSYHFGPIPNVREHTRLIFESKKGTIARLQSVYLQVLEHLGIDPNSDSETSHSKKTSKSKHKTSKRKSK
jgi:hypothetical protein